MLAVLLTAQAARASDPPSLQLTAPQLRAKRELNAGTGLVIAGVVLVLAGSVLTTQRGETYLAGVGVASGGGAATLAGCETIAYAAGHRAALRRGGDAAALDRADARARNREYAGFGVLVGGLTLFGVGTALAFTNFHLFGDSGSNNDAGLYAAGVVLSVLGDAGWLTGSLLWSYGGGERRGIREVRSALAVSPTAVAGTF